MPEDKASQLRIDVATLKPTPRATVTYDSTEYEVLSLLDLEYDDMLDILGAQLRPKIEGETILIYNVRRARAQLVALVPSIATRSHKMSFNEMEAFLNAALGVGENPPQGDPNPS